MANQICQAHLSWEKYGATRLIDLLNRPKKRFPFPRRVHWGGGGKGGGGDAPCAPMFGGGGQQLSSSGRVTRHEKSVQNLDEKKSAWGEGVSSGNGKRRGSRNESSTHDHNYDSLRVPKKGQ